MQLSLSIRWKNLLPIVIKPDPSCSSRTKMLYYILPNPFSFLLTWRWSLAECKKKKKIYQARPSQLDTENVGPFRIYHALSVEVFELEIPPAMQIHPVFQTSLLSPTENVPLPKNLNLDLLLLLQIWDTTFIFYVDRTLHSGLNKRRKNMLQYLIEWESKEPTWKSWEAIINASKALTNFRHRNPEKAGPHASVRLQEVRL